MKDLKHLSKAAQTAQKEFEDAISENTYSEIMSLTTKKCSEEVSFLIQLLIRGKDEWKIQTEKYGITWELLIKERPGKVRTVRNLREAAESIFKRNLSQFCDERFAKFTFIYELGGKITLTYSQHSGYGDHAELGIVLRLSKKTSKVINIERTSSTVNDFYCTDPWIERFGVNNATKMTDWMMAGFK